MKVWVLIDAIDYYARPVIGVFGHEEAALAARKVAAEKEKVDDSEIWFYIEDWEVGEALREGGKP